MYSVSDRFLLATNRSGKRKTVVDLTFDGATLFEDVPIVSGNLSFDRKSAVRGRGSIQLASKDVDWINLDPWGSEITIRTGVLYSDGTEELVPMGKFRIEDYGVDEADFQINPQFNFFDRGKLFEDVVGWDADYSGRFASSVVTEIVSFCTGSFMTLPVNFDIPDYKLPGGSVYAGSDLDSLTTIAAAKGGEVWFDRDGEIHLGIVPTVDANTNIDDAVYDISVGINLISAHRVHTRDGSYNAILVYGAADSAGNKVQALAIDTNPGSKSNWDGPYGRRIKTVNLPQLTTTTAAYNAAVAELKKTTGLVKTTTFSALWNPALDVGDIISLFYFDSTMEFHQIDSIQVDLTGWKMDVTTRSVQLIE